MFSGGNSMALKELSCNQIRSMRIAEIFNTLNSQKQEIIENDIKKIQKEVSLIKDNQKKILESIDENGKALMLVLRFLDSQNGSKVGNAKSKDTEEQNFVEDDLFAATTFEDAVKVEYDIQENEVLEVDYDAQGNDAILDDSFERRLVIDEDIPVDDQNQNENDNQRRDSSDEGHDVEVVRFFNLTKDQGFRKMKAQSIKDLVDSLPSQKEIEEGVPPFSVENKKAILKQLKSGMSETVIGPPISREAFKEIYKGQEWKGSWTRLSDFSLAGRRDSIKTSLGGDFEEEARTAPPPRKHKMLFKSHKPDELANVDNWRRASYDDPIPDEASDEEEPLVVNKINPNKRHRIRTSKPKTKASKAPIAPKAGTSASSSVAKPRSFLPKKKKPKLDVNVEVTTSDEEFEEELDAYNAEAPKRKWKMSSSLPRFEPKDTKSRPKKSSIPKKSAK